MLLSRYRPTTQDQGRMGGATEYFSQPERWQGSGPRARGRLLRLRFDSSRSGRSDREVGNTTAQRHRWDRASSLPEISTDLEETARDVELLAMICRMMLQGEHLRRQGLLMIAELAAHMNPSGSRRYSAEQIEASAR
jgi:hypothetical protein